MIEIKQFAFNPFATNSYILYDETKECVIVDPACFTDIEKAKLSEFIEENKLKPVAILNTHCHVDHITGNEYVKNKYNIEILANKEEDYLIDAAEDSARVYGFDLQNNPPIDKYIGEEDVIKFGNSELKILHVPGHTRGSLAYYSTKDKFVLAGDVLFNGSIGRTDLEGGNLDTLLNSIKTKMFKLDHDTVVYSGHGPETTIGVEINSNPFLLDNVM